MKKKHKIILSVISLFVAACIGVGLYLAHKNQEFQNEMFRIVHSEEVRELIEEDLKRKDPNALTDKGKIRSYKIDDSSIKHNPMGGIMFHIIINDSISMVGKTGLRMDGENGKIRTDGMTESAGLRALLESDDK
ncbi:DUF1310 domain-containing protein [Streptococcus sanguinis]|jgi:conserved uncharacterized protein|uniref:DUF1310 family protein n=2 Tax=Streptococcus sanguinis TaxID=1305 RepID=F3UEQ5_STRSA|nr:MULTISPECIES: DUF1310 family protein [Streptococcus]EGC22357.1 hypothetical protein HMPREF9388_1574 [Streptococcus sanguinis SK353]EGJ36391.1 hypothetical protein HMPREF9393_2109 [Streptococcus sanguinis SK1056]EJO19618.1 PF07006 family protein [Streptococcus sp. AS14]MBZ2023071.1 DUF1310 domain-containing protein [Streptococcus sanguinis]MBZ2047901.1 DUF1310 domain-containing protein [Streptococcus sanguinis]